MSLIFFHGAEILVFLVAMVAGAGICLGMLIWALTGPAKPWAVPTVYLLLGVPLTLSEILTDNFHGLWATFTFPWSIVATYIVFSTLSPTEVSTESEFSTYWMIPAIIFNALLFFLIAKFLGKKPIDTTPPTDAGGTDQ